MGVSNRPNVVLHRALAVAVPFGGGTFIRIGTYSAAFGQRFVV